MIIKQLKDLQASAPNTNELVSLTHLVPQLLETFLDWCEARDFKLTLAQIAYLRLNFEKFVQRKSNRPNTLIINQKNLEVVLGMSLNPSSYKTLALGELDYPVLVLKIKGLEVSVISANTESDVLQIRDSKDSRYLINSPTYGVLDFSDSNIVTVIPVLTIGEL